MEIDIVTKRDLQAFRNDLLNDLAKLLQATAAPEEKEYLRSRSVRAMLGGISAATLQSLRVKGLLTPTKIEGVFYYKTTEVRALLNAGSQR